MLQPRALTKGRRLVSQKNLREMTSLGVHVLLMCGCTPCSIYVSPRRVREPLQHRHAIRCRDSRKCCIATSMLASSDSREMGIDAADWPADVCVM